MAEQEDFRVWSVGGLLVICVSSTLRVFEVTGVDCTLTIFASLPEALAAKPVTPTVT